MVFIRLLGSIGLGRDSDALRTPDIEIELFCPAFGPQLMAVGFCVTLHPKG